MGISWISWQALCKMKETGRLGFRELETFNLALLAKQVWRIITEPHLLLSRVWKARYFPSTSIFNANLGERLSATWRSLLADGPYVEHGLMRRMGNGASTHIWGESWLQSQDSGRIITRRPFDSAHPDRVSDLIDGEQGTWGEGLIRQVFWETDARRILQTPLGSDSSPDKYVWTWSKHENFTVRSCYHHIMNTRLVDGAHDAGTTSGVSHGEWKWYGLFTSHRRYEYLYGGLVMIYYR